MEKDRINYSLSRKLSDSQFGSYQVSFSYSTDIDTENESLEEATERCIAYVEQIVEKKLKTKPQNVPRGTSVQTKQNQFTSAPLPQSAAPSENPKPGCGGAVHERPWGTWRFPKGKLQGRCLAEFDDKKLKSIRDFWMKDGGAKGWCKEAVEKIDQYLSGTGSDVMNEGDQFL